MRESLRICSVWCTYNLWNADTCEVSHKTLEKVYSKSASQCFFYDGLMHTNNIYVMETAEVIEKTRQRNVVKMSNNRTDESFNAAFSFIDKVMFSANGNNTILLDTA